MKGNYILCGKLERSTGHNLGKEIVTAVCALTLINLFLYMFTDFLNAQLKLVPERSRRPRPFSHLNVVIVGILGFQNCFK